MTFDVRLRKEAEQDLEDAALWYEAQSQGLGHEYLGAVEATLSQIAENPSMYPLVHRSTHRALIRKFPFGIYYRVVGNSIIVIAILHGSRHPRRWKMRS
jgi:plasmid stabilization system protein ParE